MKIVRAAAMGMCFGVRDAIAMAREVSSRTSLTILGDLVHNQTVLDDLQSRGIKIVSELAEVKTDAVMITAHGASERRLNDLAATGRQLYQATCPLVEHAHHSIQRLARAGYHPVIIGKRDHVEVRGLTEDLADFDVVLQEADVSVLVERDRFGIAAQTTQPIERVHFLVDLIRRRFPRSEIRFVDTVCQPTKQRQLAAVELARRCDLVLVIGGRESNNTRELVTTCRKVCSKVFHVEDEKGLNPEWFDGIETVGITAGTSTPDSVIEAVETCLLNRGAGGVILGA